MVEHTGLGLKKNVGLAMNRLKSSACGALMKPGQQVKWPRAMAIESTEIFGPLTRKNNTFKKSSYGSWFQNPGYHKVPDSD